MEITELYLDMIAGDIKALLMEQREGIAYTFARIPDGLKISIGVTIDQIGDSVNVVDYALSYDLQPKPEPSKRARVKSQRVISRDQVELALGGEGQ